MTPSKRCANRWNSHWITGATKLQLASLARGDQLLQNLYVIEDDTVRYPHRSELPWYVILTLATHSRKHVFNGQALPPAKSVAQCSRNLFNKFCWAWKHRSSSDKAAIVIDSLRLDKKTPPYGIKDLQPQPEFDWCRNMFFRTFMDFYNEARRLAVKSMPKSNLPRFVSATRLWLRETCTTAALSDKDGVFALLTDDYYNTLLQSQLDRS